MKNLKIGFASIIAVLAVSLTIAAQAGVFESKKVVRIDNCFIPSSTLPYDADCTNPPQGTLTPTTTCPNAQDALQAHAFSGVTDGAKILDANVSLECGGDQVLCCVYLEVDGSPCIAQGQEQFELNELDPAYYKIVGIECKPIIVP